MGSGYYGVRDTGGTFADGRRTGSLEGDVEAYASGIKGDAQAVDAGSKNGCQAVNTAAHDLGSDMYAHARTVAREVANLGAATSDVGVTVEQTSNETTTLNNTTGALSRRVNGTTRTALAV